MPDSPALDLQRVFQALPDCYLVLAPDGPTFTILAASDAYLQATMTERATIVGKGALEVFPDNPDDPTNKAVDFARASFERVVASRHVDVMGIRKHDVRRPNSEKGEFEERYWNAVNFPVLDANGEVTGIIHRVEDVTEQVRLQRAETEQMAESRLLHLEVLEHQRTEQRLALANERLTLAQRSAGAGMWDWDMASGQLDWSPELYRLFGLDPEAEATFDTWRAVVHPEDRQVAETRISDAVRDRDRLHSDYRVVLRSGEVRWIQALGDTVYDERGVPTRMSGICLDVTERRRAQDALRESMRLYRLLFDHMLNGIAYCRMLFEEGKPPDFIYVAVNPAFESQTGLTNVVGKRVSEVIPGIQEADPQIFEIYGRVAATGQPERFETFLKSRQTWFSLAVFCPEPEHFVAVFDVITERKQAEEAKARLEAQLQQAQKMESVGRLAGGLAHDFNNMLGVIIGHTEIALEGVDPGHPLQPDLMEIRAAAERSAELTRQLLAFARQQKIEPKVLDLNEAVAGALKMLGRLIGEHIRLNWQPAADLWPAKIDPVQLDQILANLSVNARDAIEGVGTLTISTANDLRDEAGCANFPGMAPGEYVRVTVSDDGCGMTRETVSHIFEPFFTTKGVGKGTGLGLASVYGAVRQNQGHIGVQSEPGVGTTLTMLFPRVLETVGPPAGEGGMGASERGHETILLVEDEPALLNLTKAILTRQGYTVLAAITPGEAIRWAEEYHGPIHLLLTDVVMPEMNGPALARRLDSIRPGLRRLFMSGYSPAIIPSSSLMDEGVSFLQKPFSVDSLSAKVREALERE